MRLVGLLVLVLALAACAAVTITPSGEAAQSDGTRASPSSEPSSTPEVTSVICDVFGDPAESIREAVMANITDDNPAGPLRDGIRGLEEVGQRASGEEREDIEDLADRLDDAALAADYGRVLDQWDPFYVKYAERCGLKSR